MSKIKLRMVGNKMVTSFDQNPNSIICDINPTDD